MDLVASTLHWLKVKLTDNYSPPISGLKKIGAKQGLKVTL